MSKRNDSSFAEKLSSIRENHPILLKAILLLIVLVVVFRLFVLPTLSAIRISSGESASENRVYNAVAVPSSKEVPQNNSTINANDAEERVESNAAEVAPDVIATGIRDGCTWTVEADGDLIIAPTDGVSGVITSTTGYAHPEWYKYNSQITRLYIRPGVVASEDISWLFCEHNFVEAYVSELDMSNCRDASWLFANDINLVYVDASLWNTSKLENATRMFSGCSSLATVEAAHWNMESVTVAEALFQGCKSLTHTGCENWKLPKLEQADFMLLGSSLDGMDVSMWELPESFDQNSLR